MKNLLINIHGFLSSYESDKIQSFRQSIKDCYDIQFLSPSLPDNPELAVQEVEKIIEANKHNVHIALIGHSLGGYYATYLASKHNLRAVLINPVVRGYEIMCEFLGDQSNLHTGNKFKISEEDIEFLFKINIEEIKDKSRFLVMLQLEDEIVDPGDALEYYKGCKTMVEKGGNHDFASFSSHTKSIVDFAFPHRI